MKTQTSKSEVKVVLHPNNVILKFQDTQNIYVNYDPITVLRALTLGAQLEKRSDGFYITGVRISERDIR